MLNSSNHEDIVLAILMDTKRCIELMDKPGKTSAYSKSMIISNNTSADFGVVIKDGMAIGFRPNNFIGLIEENSYRLIRSNHKIFWTDNSIRI